MLNATKTKLEFNKHLMVEITLPYNEGETLSEMKNKENGSFVFFDKLLDNVCLLDSRNAKEKSRWDNIMYDVLDVGGKPQDRWFKEEVYS